MVKRKKAEKTSDDEDNEPLLNRRRRLSQMQVLRAYEIRDKENKLTKYLQANFIDNISQLFYLQNNLSLLNYQPPDLLPNSAHDYIHSGNSELSKNYRYFMFKKVELDQFIQNVNISNNIPQQNLIDSDDNLDYHDDDNEIYINFNDGKLAEYLNSFVFLDDDLEGSMKIDEYNLWIENKLAVTKRIMEMKEEGLLTSSNPTTPTDSKKFIDPIEPKNFTSALSKEMADISKVMAEMRRHKVLVCKKLSKAVLKFWEVKIDNTGKSEKLEEKRIKKLAKDTANEVKKAWKLVESIVTAKRKIYADLEQKKAGKLHLFAIMEQSTQVLKDQQLEMFGTDNLSETSINNNDENSSEVSNEDHLSNISDDEKNHHLNDDHQTNISDNDDVHVENGVVSNGGTFIPAENQNVGESSFIENGESSFIKNKKNVGDESFIESENTGGSFNENENTSGSGNLMKLIDENLMDFESDQSDEFSSEEEEDDDDDEEEDDDEQEDEEENDMMDVNETTIESVDRTGDSSGQLVALATPIPPLLKHTLREYQGLGKTIQTIALFSYLAYYKGIWGPHLIVVPTSVMLNWEYEIKKWCPGLKVLTYYGNQKERKEKRAGWTKDNSFHICITSYQLVISDQVNFRRKYYMVLDEAHNIKNFRSQRWQTLLTFNAERRLLLTGTPLQNNLMELWSLLYFLMPRGGATEDQVMPAGFANQKEFQEWFQNPVDKLLDKNSTQEADRETKETVLKLHTILRPFLLRRLKCDVEKEMPVKIEHVVTCRLSRRQRFLYDDFMSRAKTKDDMASNNYMSILNCLMQLRKVCNHPDLFEVRSIVTSFAMGKTVYEEIANSYSPFKKLFNHPNDISFSNLYSFLLSFGLIIQLNQLLLCDNFEKSDPLFFQKKIKILSDSINDIGEFDSNDFSDTINYKKVYDNRVKIQELNRWKKVDKASSIRISSATVSNLYPYQLIQSSLKLGSLDGAYNVIDISNQRSKFLDFSAVLRGLVMSVKDRIVFYDPSFCKFSVPTRKVQVLEVFSNEAFSKSTNTIHSLPIELLRFYQSDKNLYSFNLRLGFALPEKYLLQYDCGKLQTLAILLRDLQSGGHRALIFTQMTRMLDILEGFLNMHGYIYLRLDGSTSVTQRQILMDRFNNDNRILVFILSTRSGGVGMNLVGADSVIFYDSDWNPAMDAQAQDRAHRIGQTRDVHIYRFITEHTIEENMLKKANKKRALDNLVIQDGQFNTDFFRKMHWTDWLGVGENPEGEGSTTVPETPNLEEIFASVEDEADVVALKKARTEITTVDVEDFNEDEVGKKAEVLMDDVGVEKYMIKFVLDEWGFSSLIQVDEFFATS